MADKRPSYAKFLTPAGIAQWPALTKPDTKFDDDGVYKTNMIFEDTPEIRKLVATLEGIRDANFKEATAEMKQAIKDAPPAKQKKLKKSLADLEVVEVYEEELDDAGEETGRLILKFKLNAVVRPKGKDAFKQAPNLFDTSKPPVPLKGVDPWSGSTLKIAGEVIPYVMASTGQAGVSLRLKGVQVINLVSGGGKDAAAYGFGAEDGGFQQEADAGSDDFDADSGDDGEDDDF